MARKWTAKQRAAKSAQMKRFWRGAEKSASTRTTKILAGKPGTKRGGSRYPKDVTYTLPDGRTITPESRRRMSLAAKRGAEKRRDARKRLRLDERERAAVDVVHETVMDRLHKQQQQVQEIAGSTNHNTTANDLPHLDVVILTDGVEVYKNGRLVRAFDATRRSEGQMWATVQTEIAEKTKAFTIKTHGTQ